MKVIDPLINNYTSTEINRTITKDKDRNEMILSDIEKEFNRGKNLLVLTKRIEHLECIQARLLNITDNVFIYKGGFEKKTLKEI